MAPTKRFGNVPTDCHSLKVRSVSAESHWGHQQRPRHREAVEGGLRTSTMTEPRDGRNSPNVQMIGGVLNGEKPSEHIEICRICVNIFTDFHRFSEIFHLDISGTSHGGASRPKKPRPRCPTTASRRRKSWSRPRTSRSTSPLQVDG